MRSAHKERTFLVLATHSRSFHARLAILGCTLVHFVFHKAHLAYGLVDAAPIAACLCDSMRNRIEAFAD